ncbi:MAG TPA: efflux RND transporter periplasmic adaptor subunit [Methylomirabilota bacterium]|nr:efflux RND transporter periplasmic adaptor subunit [Methylomirabilota bacterium]
MSSPPGRLDCRTTAAVLSAAALVALLALAAWRPELTTRLVAENCVVEWLQVLLTTAAAALAALQGRRALAEGRPVAFEVAVVMSMVMVSIGEVDLDRAIFGTKVISTRFFVNPRYSLPVRGLAVLVIVGVPLAVGVWLLTRWRHLWRTGREALREPWGQAAAFGAALFLAVETFERPLEQLRSLPPHFAEETLELVAAVFILAGLAARRRDIMSRMSARSVIVLAAMALSLSACRGELPASAAQDKAKPPGPPPREVRVVPAVERALPRTVTATGTLAAEDQMTLSAKVAGRVERIDIDLGSRVRRGQPIAQLDQTDFKLRIEQAEAALQQARARLGLTPTGTDERIDPQQTAIVRQARAVLEEARLTRDRSVKLLEQQLIARAQLDTAEANLQVAEGRYQDAIEEVRNRQAVLAQRRSELELARQQLADTVVVAPVDGAVSQRQASPGEFLAAGAPMAILVRIHPLRLRVSVPERESSSVQTGQAVRLTIDGDATVYNGRVVRLAPIVQELNRTLAVEAEVPNERGLLRPGAFARAEIVTDAAQPVLTVPRSALVVFAGVEKVLVVRGGKTAEVRVQTGRRLGEEIEIVEGLMRGEAVVDKPGNLTGGQAVSVRE